MNKVSLLHLTNEPKSKDRSHLQPLYLNQLDCHLDGSVWDPLNSIIRIQDSTPLQTARMDSVWGFGSAFQIIWRSSPEVWNLSQPERQSLHHQRNSFKLINYWDTISPYLYFGHHWNLSVSGSGVCHQSREFIFPFHHEFIRFPKFGHRWMETSSLNCSTRVGQIYYWEPNSQHREAGEITTDDLILFRVWFALMRLQILIKIGSEVDQNVWDC